MYEPSYSPRSVLAAETLTVRAVKTANGFSTRADTTVAAAIREIRYDAKGQRTLLTLGNGTRTRYEYDPDTFRLVQLRTTRPLVDLPFQQTHSNLQDGRILQQQSYVYDAVGNIVEVPDEAYAPAFFQNQTVLPRSRYEYNALYRLTSASGREDGAPLGPSAGGEPSAADVTFPVATVDPQALRNYSRPSNMTRSAT